MAEILHSLTIKTSPGRLYHALTDQKGLANWWTRDVVTEPRVDTIAKFTFDRGRINYRMKIIRLIQNKLVMWHCLSGHPEWEGTQIIFEIVPKDRVCQLNFMHRGWRTTSNAFPQCNFDWAHYLASLRSYLEKDRGFPARG